MLIYQLVLKTNLIFLLNILFSGNRIWNVVCKMAAILLSPKHGYIERLLEMALLAPSLVVISPPSVSRINTRTIAWFREIFTI